MSQSVPTGNPVLLAAGRAAAAALNGQLNAGSVVAAGEEDYYDYEPGDWESESNEEDPGDNHDFVDLGAGAGEAAGFPEQNVQHHVDAEVAAAGNGAENVAAPIPHPGGLHVVVWAPMPGDDIVMLTQEFPYTRSIIFEEPEVRFALRSFCQRMSDVQGTIYVNVGVYWCLRLVKRILRESAGNQEDFCRIMNRFITHSVWPTVVDGRTVDFLLATGIPDNALLLMCYQPGHQLPRMSISNNHAREYMALWIGGALFQGKLDLAVRLARHLGLYGVGRKIVVRQLEGRPPQFQDLVSAVRVVYIWVRNDWNAFVHGQQINHIADRLECPATGCQFRGTVTTVNAHFAHAGHHTSVVPCGYCGLVLPTGVPDNSARMLWHAVNCYSRPRAFFRRRNDLAPLAIAEIPWQGEMPPPTFNAPNLTMRIWVNGQRNMDNCEAVNLEFNRV